MGKKFDISAAFAQAVDVSKSDTFPEQIELIDNALLDDDPNNFYALTELEELAANIELVGLQQPIRVRPAGEGRYNIVSGHRRRAAMALLGEEKWRKVPCIVERDEASPELRELRLILANSATRVLTPAEISRQAELQAARAKLRAYLSRYAPPEPMEGGIRLLVKWCFPCGNHVSGSYRTTKPDTDNLQKLLKDCMTVEGFWKDDAQVASEICEKFWAEVPGIYIQVSAL